MHWPMDSQGAFPAPTCHAQQLGPSPIDTAVRTCALLAWCSVHHAREGYWMASALQTGSAFHALAHGLSR